MFRFGKILSWLRRSVGFTAFLLVAGILGVQYAGFWYALNVAEISAEEQLQRHMQNIGAVAGGAVAPLALPVAELAMDLERRHPDLARFPIPSADGPISAFAASVAHEDLTFALNDFIGRAGLREAVILDPEGRVLAVTPAARQILQPWPHLDLDYDAFLLALDGRVASSLAYTVDADPLKRVYAPLIRADEVAESTAAGDAEVAAVICLTAGGGFLAPLVRLPGNIRVINGVLTLLVLAMGFLFYRMLIAQRGIERRAAHADRLSSLGSLAAGFAHEIRNPLEIISACTGDLQKTLRERKFDAEEAAETCADILEEVGRMDQLVEGFLQYSRADATTDPGDFAAAGPVAADACRFMTHAARRVGVGVETDAAEGDASLTVPMAAGPLRQVLINLLMNAVQASPRESTVRLTMRADPPSGPRRVVLRVCDEGPGIAPEIRGRIFEPFYTTRDGGSGLGLAIAHQLVTRAGGRLTVAERRGVRGACLEISLPATRTEPRSDPDARPLTEATA